MCAPVYQGYSGWKFRKFQTCRSHQLHPWQLYGPCCACLSMCTWYLPHHQNNRGGFLAGSTHGTYGRNWICRRRIYTSVLTHRTRGRSVASCPTPPDVFIDDTPEALTCLAGIVPHRFFFDRMEGEHPPTGTHRVYSWKQFEMHLKEMA